MTTKNILSPNWMGERALPIDPAQIRFTAIESPVPADVDRACKGCIFENQSYRVCDVANRLAAGRDLPDCGDPSPNGTDFVFVLDKSDTRQIDLLKEARP